MQTTYLLTWKTWCNLKTCIMHFPWYMFWLCSQLFSSLDISKITEDLASGSYQISSFLLLLDLLFFIQSWLFFHKFGNIWVLTSCPNLFLLHTSDPLQLTTQTIKTLIQWHQSSQYFLSLNPPDHQPSSYRLSIRHVKSAQITVHTWGHVNPISVFNLFSAITVRQGRWDAITM